MRVTVLSGLHDERSKARRAGCHYVGGSNGNLPLNVNVNKKKGARENDRWEGKINNPSFPSFRNSQFLDCPSLSSALLTECW